jgi:alpha-1,2-glucosyltransferase
MSKTAFVVVFSALLFVVALVVVIRDPVLHSDETAHYEQILQFARGNMVVDPEITTIPTYNFLLALPFLLTGISPSPGLIRFFNFCIGLFCIGTFYRTSRAIDSASTFLKTIQFAFFPILFPFFFLIFTDVLSLALVLLAFLFTLKKRYVLAGLSGIAATAVRQNNVIWVVFLLAFVIREQGWTRESWKKIGPFLPAVVFLASFLILRGSPVMGDVGKHPIKLSAGNLYFLLFVSFFLFLPLQVQKFSSVVAFFKAHRLALLIPLFFFAATLVTFRVDHPYNTGNMFFLRNRLLMLSASSLLSKAIFLIPATLALCTFMAIRPVPRYFWLLALFTVLFLIPSWLIEQRYYLIPFSLFLLIKPMGSSRDEYLAYLWNVFLSFGFLTGIVTNRFFL